MKTLTILLGTLAITALAACSSNGESADISNGQATFSAAVGGMSSSRAYDATWEAGDLIGITGTSGEKQYANVAYAAEAAGNSVNFSAVTAGTEIYYQDNNVVNFTAYYPKTELTDNVTAIIETWGQAGQKWFDFLWDQATGSKANPSVAFNFGHKMAKLVITVKKGDDVTYDEVKAAVLSLEGFKNRGTFNAADGTTATTGNKSGAWTFANNAGHAAYNAPVSQDDYNGTAAYSLLFFPQEFDTSLPIYAELTDKQTFTTNLDFTTANANAGDVTPKNAWVAGRQYNLSVTLYKTKLVVEGCTINDWTPANGGDFVAK